MKLRKTLISRHLLGYFQVEGDSMIGCYVIDWRYASEIANSIIFSGDDEHPQIALSINSDLNKATNIPVAFQQKGYIRVGVFPSFNLRLYKRVEQNFPEYIDIPVYVYFKKDWQVYLSIELDEWMSALDIVSEEEENRVLKEKFPTQVFELPKSKELPRKRLFGYCTATGGGILICENDWLKVRACYKNFYFLDYGTQVTQPDEGEDMPGFRVGVFFAVPEELQDREFPVYGEYEGDFLKRIVIEIAQREEGKKVWDYNFSYSK
jgi:hypothetical protein